MQNCACCYVTLAGKLRPEARKTTEICQNTWCLYPWTHHYKHAVSHFHETTQTHTTIFQAYSHQTSRSTFPVITMQLRRERACLAVWDQPTLIMTWLIYSSVAEGVALEEEGSGTGKTDHMRQDSQVLKREENRKRWKFVERPSATGQARAEGKVR